MRVSVAVALGGLVGFAGTKSWSTEPVLRTERLEVRSEQGELRILAEGDEFGSRLTMLAADGSRMQIRMLDGDDGWHMVVADADGNPRIDFVGVAGARTALTMRDPHGYRVELSTDHERGAELTMQGTDGGRVALSSHADEVALRLDHDAEHGVQLVARDKDVQLTLRGSGARQVVAGTAADGSAGVMVEDPQNDLRCGIVSRPDGSSGVVVQDGDTERWLDAATATVPKATEATFGAGK